jgi:uncharacterized protein YbjT (DUF2867 family)
MPTTTSSQNILVTGATGYIGGRLVPRLLDRGHRVRVLVRDRSRVMGRPWADRVEICVGDIEDPVSLVEACSSIDTAYYLVHQMDTGAGFPQREQRAAEGFAAAASGIRRIIYLGGLQPDADDVSPHLSSRATVGRVLRERVPTLELRAGPVIGSGSASFEMVRYLTERLPAMIAPKWILNPVQPISVRDALSYLEAALDRGGDGIMDIGGDPLTFRDMMLEFARVRGLKRVIIPVPVLAPRLAALWVGAVTPISNRLAVPLIEGVIHPVLADTARARQAFPEIVPLPYAEAVRLALKETDERAVSTRWSGALGSTPAFELTTEQGLIREVRACHAAASPEQVFRTFCSIGGDRGWLVWNWAWKLRGLMDSLVGGPGLRRGRRHPTELLVGDAVDFWRVEAVEFPRRLRLRAEMKVPGRAWLQWEAIPEGDGTRLVQTALFEPFGLTGQLYWNALYPFHKVIFSGLVHAIATLAATDTDG